MTNAEVVARIATLRRELDGLQRQLLGDQSQGIGPFVDFSNTEYHRNHGVIFNGNPATGIEAASVSEALYLTADQVEAHRAAGWTVEPFTHHHGAAGYWLATREA